MKNEILDVTEARMTDVDIINACTACIYKARMEKRGIKSLYLKPNYYFQFRDAVIRAVGEETFFDVFSGMIQYYDVNIERGDKKQKIAILPEYWPEN